MQNNPMDNIIMAAAERLVRLLVEKKYSEIALITKNQRLTETQISEAISEYGRTLINPPSSFPESVDITPVIDSNPPRWSVDFPLWTLEEGESDLSIEMTCYDNGNDELEIELDGIHVL
ncbi:MAG: hypothetical protein AB7F88_12635 [Pyrinomonadaceae bacterium]